MEICKRGDINPCQLLESTGTEECFEDVFLALVMHICVWACSHGCECLQRPGNVMGSLWLEWEDLWAALPGPGNRAPSGPLWEQDSIIMAEPSPQTQKIVLYKWQWQEKPVRLLQCCQVSSCSLKLSVELFFKPYPANYPTEFYL